MGKKLKLGLVLMFTTISSAYAMDIIPSDSNQYYQLGGGGDVSMPPVTNETDIDVGGEARANLGFVCTGFNPSISMSNSLNDIEDSVQGMQQSVIDSATSALGSLPMYILSKSNKDLYNLIENAMTDAGDTFHLSMKSCQDALSEIHDGKSPYQDWFGVSDSQGWMQRAKEAAQGKDVDINKVNNNVTKDPNSTGIPWVHEKTSGNSGGTGAGQVPIKVLYDVVIAGYNATVDPKSNLDSTFTRAQDGTALARYFPSAGDAGNWAKLVLGDITIKASDPKNGDEGKDDTARGTGLMTIIQACPGDDDEQKDLTCIENISTHMKALVASNKYPGDNPDDLKKVSSNQMIASPKLIEAIRNKDAEGQALAIGKWSQDVAILNVVDKAYTLRRLLIAGAQTKPVHNLKPALDAVHNAITQLDTDINSIMQQYHIREALMTNTAQIIIGQQLATEANAQAEPDVTQRPTMVNGSFYENQSN